MDDAQFYYVKDHHKRVNIYSFMDQMQISQDDMVTLLDHTLDMYELVRWCEDIAGEDFAFSMSFGAFWFKDRGVMALFKLTWI